MSSIGTHRITIGDTLYPMNTVIRDGNGNPIDLSVYTVKFFMELENGTSELAETIVGVSVHPTQTFTAEASTDLITCNAHGIKKDDQIILASSGTLPAGLAEDTRYFAVQIQPNKFQVALIPDGSAVDITGAGTGTHTLYVVGSVQMDFAAANVGTAGIYRGWFTLTSGSEKKTMPEGDRWYEVLVVSAGS